MCDDPVDDCLISALTKCWIENEQSEILKLVYNTGNISVLGTDI